MKRFLKPWWGKVIAVAFLLLLLFAFAAGYFIWRINGILPRAQPFSAELWRSADTSQQNNPRCLMRGDLIQNHLNLGMTRAESTALLGELEAGELEAGESESTGQTTSYYLGFCSPFGIDGMALGLEFDASNKLSRIYDIQY